MNIVEIIKNKVGSIIDVRTPAEFAEGSIDGSVNIPLHEIESRVDELRLLEQPLLLCCASGMRSEQAKNYLLRYGFNCYNAGSWLDVRHFINDK